MTRDHVFRLGTTLSVLACPDHSSTARWKEGKEREKEKAKDDPKRQEEYFCWMNWYKTLNGRQKRTSSHQPDRGAGKDFHQNKGRGKDQKGTGTEGTFPQSGLSSSETPNEEGYGCASESDDLSSSHSTSRLGSAIERFKKHALFYSITKFCRCNESFVSANSQTETCMENCIIHFPTTQPCSS